jgi:hypothetical protein
LAREVIARMFDMEVSDVIRLETDIFRLKSLDDIPKIKLDREIKIELDAVVDGSIKQGESKDHQTQVTINATKAKDPKIVVSKTTNLPVFEKIPSGSRKEKLAAPVLRMCRFALKNQRCPYGRNCKFSHTPN